MKNVLIVLLLFFVFVLTGCNKQTTAMPSGNEGKTAPKTSSAGRIADKLEVYYFYRTQRCYSCLTIGEYVGKTISEYYSEQIKQGKIDYQEINIDLAKNKELARKFQAGGSSLFINAIQGEKDNIENVMEVWRLTGDEARFKNFLKQKIDTLLGS